jgi:hypothetical protein
MESRKRKRTDGRRIWSTSLQAGGVGVGVDQGRPFEAVLLVLARSGRRRMSTKPRPFGSQASGMVSQEILMGTTATDETLQSGRSDRALVREPILRAPTVTHPRPRALITARPMSCWAARSV